MTLPQDGSEITLSAEDHAKAGLPLSLVLAEELSNFRGFSSGLSNVVG